MAIQNLLSAAAATLTTSAAWLPMLRVAARFTSYSARNVCLLWLQAEQRGVTLTRVAGYRAWQAMGRQVAKGARSFAVLAPVRRQLTAEAAAERAAAGQHPPADRDHWARRGGGPGVGASGAPIGAERAPADAAGERHGTPGGGVERSIDRGELGAVGLADAEEPVEPVSPDHVAELITCWVPPRWRVGLLPGEPVQLVDQCPDVGAPSAIGQFERLPGG